MRVQFPDSTVRDSVVSIQPGRYKDQIKDVEKHIHDEYEISLLLDGKKEYIVNDRKYTLEKGDIFFVNRNVAHSSVMYPMSPVIVIIFSKNTSNNTALFTHSMEEFFDEDCILIKSGTDANKELKKCIETAREEQVNKKPSYENYIKAQISMIFAILYRYKILTNPEDLFAGKKTERFLPVIEYVNDNISSSFTLENVSSILNVNKAHFCRLFKAEFGISFVDYLNFARIMNAEKLLLTTKLPISEITDRCGFSSMAYFGKVFKEYKHCTPSEYRKFKS